MTRRASWCCGSGETSTWFLAVGGSMSRSGTLGNSGASSRGILDTVDEVLIGGSKSGIRAWYTQERAAQKTTPERVT